MKLSVFYDTHGIPSICIRSHFPFFSFESILNHKHHAIQSQVHFGMAVDADLVRQVLFKRIASLESQGSEFVQEI